MLEGSDYKVDLADDGWDGVKMIKKTHYDLIILDIKMPGIDGQQVLGIIKKLDENLPVLILSGYLTKDVFLKMQRLGVKGFLSKPFGYQNLLDTVGGILSGSKK